MSKKKKSNKKKQNNKTSVSMLGDNRKQRNRILIGLAISCIMAIIIFAFILPSTLNETPNEDDTNKQTINDTLSLSLLGSSLVESKQYNVWFDINSSLSDGEITFSAHDGFVMKYNNETGESTIVESISLSEAKQYSFVWAFDKTSSSILTDVTVTIENKTNKAEAGFYLFCEEESMGYLDRVQYKLLREADDKLNSKDE